MGCVSLLVYACGPDYETEQLHITLADDATRGFCAGDLHFLQGEVDRIEAALGITMTKPLDLVYTTALGAGEDGFEGRYFAGRHRAETNPAVVSHELVHAVLGKPGAKSMDQFFLEGTAEALRGTHTRMPRVMTRPSDNLGREDSSDVHYPTAGHFVRWLYEERGAAGIRSLREGRSFADVYGESIESAQERWWTHAPWLYPAPDPCPFPMLDRVDDQWHASFVVSCDDEDVRSHAAPGLTTCRTFEIEAEGLYLYTSNADSRIERCQQEIIVDPPTVEREAIPAAHDHNRSSEYFERDEEHEALFRVGLHMVCVDVDDDMSDAVEITVTPTATSLARP